MRIGNSKVTRVTAWGLLALMAAPASGGERRQKVLRWEALAQLKPGTALELALDDGRHLAGRLLTANAHEASVADFTGRGFSEREQKRFVLELIKARGKPRPFVTANAQATATASSEDPVVRHVARDQVASVHVPSGGSILRDALKVVAVVAGVYFLVLLSLILSCGGNSQCLS